MNNQKRRGFCPKCVGITLNANPFTVIFALIIIQGLWITPSECQSNHRDSRIAIVHAEDKARDAWMYELWNANEKPYEDVRDSLKKSLVLGRPDGRFLRTCREQEDKAKAAPNDALAQFSRAVATYRLLKIMPDVMRPDTALKAMASVPSPHSYEFARMRFLLQMADFPWRSLKPVGERLLRRNPNDYDVIFFFIKTLDSSDKSEKQRSINYARHLIKMLPKAGASYSALGEAYWSAWLVTKSNSDGNLAVTAFQKAIDLEPNNPAAGKTKGLIKWIQSERQGISPSKRR